MKIRFFCDSCGREVSAEAARCPGCGKFFSAVECPRCALRGPAPLFGSGCPACGYLFAGPGKGRVPRSGAKRAEKSRTFISQRVFRWLTAVLVLLLLVFLVLLLVSPFNR
jgi:uncharacterized membrane protein YvbJ